MTRTEPGRAGDARAPAQSRQGQVGHASEIYNRALEQCRHTRAAFQRLRQAQNQGQPDGQERIEFAASLRAFHELNLELHETMGRAESGPRRAMHEAFRHSHDAYRTAQATLVSAEQARGRGEDDGPEQAAFHTQVRAYHQLSRAAHELAAKVEPSCQEGSLVRINDALQSSREE